MDELKPFSIDETELQNFTIGKAFGQDECTTPVFKHDKLSKSHNLSRNNQTVRRDVVLDETSKCRGQGSIRRTGIRM